MEIGEGTGRQASEHSRRADGEECQVEENAHSKLSSRPRTIKKEQRRRRRKKKRE
jgi:hypothetical protein